MLVMSLCVIYQLNFTVFVYVTRISRYIYRSVLSAVLRKRSRSWNVLPADTGVRLCIYLCVPARSLAVSIELYDNTNRLKQSL